MFVLLSVFYYFYFSIVGIYIIFLPKVLSGVGYDASEIGIIFAASPLVRFILPFLFMRGLTLNATIFKSSLFIVVASALSFYFSLEHFYALLLSNVFLGLGMSLMLPFVEVISLHSIGKERYGKVRLFGSLGFIAVALVLVKFLSSAYVALDFLLVLTLLTAFVAYKVLHRAPDTTYAKEEHVKNDINIFKDWRLWGGLILVQMSFGSFYNFFTIYETDHGISLDMTVYLWSFGVLIEVLMFFFQGGLLRGNLLNLLRFTALATVLRWFLVFLFPQNLAILFFSQALHALSFALFHTAAISYLFHLYKHKSLSQQLFSGLTYGFGGLGGALIAGYVYEYYPKYLFLTSSLMAFGAFLLFMAVNDKKIENLRCSISRES
ncbi:MFS transporter [Sulfurimonas autotrophica]|uniref:Putative MFS metabolite transporter n=1 Tax=Sulfurimonas autotrophica (strain ATCC BAA-671 / DSM 16294 / JCM 11897 / OK10) TaxID=563040 RepID=E0USU5_SULAO|nr:MFS transporter [Sulfurimonas autotrophica]ADN08122.1 putative MFS metabolite transporter [Sulfurimonas autotrophica DSM 16294]